MNSNNSKSLDSSEIIQTVINLQDIQPKLSYWETLKSKKNISTMISNASEILGLSGLVLSSNFPIHSIYLNSTAVVTRLISEYVQKKSYRDERNLLLNKIEIIEDTIVNEQDLFDMQSKKSTPTPVKAIGTDDSLFSTSGTVCLFSIAAQSTSVICSSLIEYTVLDEDTKNQLQLAASLSSIAAIMIPRMALHYAKLNQERNIRELQKYCGAATALKEILNSESNNSIKPT